MWAQWLFVIGCAAWMAVVEVEIEGGYGWSAKTATGRMKNPLYPVIGWPYITGYHLAVWTLTLFLFHLPFLFGLVLSWGNWLQIVELWWGFWWIESVWWFVINPLWGMKKFLTVEIPWHAKRWLGLPTDYWIGLVVWAGLEGLRWVVR